MAIDVHAHYMPIEVLKNETFKELFYIADEPSGSWMHVNGKRMGRLQEGLVNLERQIEDMNNVGINMRYLCLPPFAFNYEHTNCALWAETLNRGMSQAAGFCMDRLRYLATLPLLQMDRALQELERLAADPLCVGVQIATNIAGIELDDERLEPFWKAISENRMFVLVHPHYTVKTERFARYHLRNVIGNPLDTTIAAFALMTGDVLRRNPGAKVCLSHAGGYTPLAMSRFEHARKVRDEFNEINTSYLERSRALYYDTVLHDAEALRFLEQRVSYKNILLGTDYPFDMGDERPVDTINAIGLSREKTEYILWKNAMETSGEVLQV